APRTADPDAPAEPVDFDVDLDDAVRSALERLSADAGVTMNTVVQAAWGIVLSRLTGSSDVVFGATVSGRPPQLAGVESMIGLFINTVPVRVRLAAGEAVEDLRRRIQEAQAALLDHHYVGLAEIQRVAGMGELFATLTVFESYPVDRDGLSSETDIAGMFVDDVSVSDATHYPLALVALKDPDLRFRVKYMPASFDRAMVGQLVERLVRVLDGMAFDPSTPADAIEILDAAELERLTTVSGAPSVPPRTLAQIFEAG